MTAFKRIAGGALTVIVTVALLALGIGLIAGGGSHRALGAAAIAWAAWNLLVVAIARRGSDRLVTWTFLLRPFVMGTLFLTLAAAVIAGKRSLDWVLILPIGVAYVVFGVFLLWVYRRHVRRNAWPPGGPNMRS